MNPFARLRIVRVLLAAGTAIRALAWGAVAALTVLFTAAAVDSFAGLSLVTRQRLQFVAFAAAVAASCAAAFATFAASAACFW